jgi:hypothetical protein
MNISKNGVALAVLLVEAVLSALGVEFEVGSVEKVVEGVVIALALGMAVYNQVDRTDVSAFLWKK